MNNFGFNISMRNTPEEILALGECLKSGDYKAIEVTYYEDMQDVDTFAYNKAIRQLVDEYAPQVTVHISAFNLSEENTALRSAIIHEFDKCCQYTRAMGGREVIMHCGRQFGALHVPVEKTSGVLNPAFVRAWDLSVQMYRKTCDMAAGYGMEIYTENLNRDHLTVRCKDVRKMVEDVGKDNLHIVFDIGHCHHTGGNIPEDVIDAGDLLRHLHLHDNFGEMDEHLPLGEGNIDYVAFAKALKAVNYPGLYMMELRYCTPENLKSSRELLIKCLEMAK